MTANALGDLVGVLFELFVDDGGMAGDDFESMLQDTVKLLTRWRRSLRSEGREVGVGSVRPGGGRGLGLRDTAGRTRPRDDDVCVHVVILTLCTATDALDGQGRPSALAHRVREKHLSLSASKSGFFLSNAVFAGG
jgi:hypothetical protein